MIICGGQRRKRETHDLSICAILSRLFVSEIVETGANRKSLIFYLSSANIMLQMFREAIKIFQMVKVDM